MKTDVAILAGGCFWGVQELIRKLNGVVSTEVGYTGGRNDNPTYQHHPGHAEAVKVVYSPDKLSYRKLLEYFFSIHNPTTILRQGNDVGSSYRSAIFFTTEEQKQQANQLIREIDDSGVWPGVVVTEVEQAGEFWSAEPEHQDSCSIIPTAIPAILNDLTGRFRDKSPSQTRSIQPRPCAGLFCSYAETRMGSQTNFFSPFLAYKTINILILRGILEKR